MFLKKIIFYKFILDLCKQYQYLNNKKESPIKFLVTPSLVALFVFSFLSHSQDCQKSFASIPSESLASKPTKNQNKSHILLLNRLDESTLKEALGIITELIPPVSVDSIKEKDSVIHKFIENPVKSHTLLEAFDNIVFEKRLALIDRNFKKMVVAFNHLIKTKKLNQKNLTRYLFASPFFLPPNQPIIEEGLQAFFDQNYLVSSSLLALQIEPIVRNIIAKKQFSKNDHHLKFKSLNSLLNNKNIILSFEERNPDTLSYFKIILTDEKGLNVRNLISHGHFAPQSFTQEISVGLIHLLLILSSVQK